MHSRCAIWKPPCVRFYPIISSLAPRHKFILVFCFLTRTLRSFPGPLELTNEPRSTRSFWERRIAIPFAVLSTYKGMLQLSNLTISSQEHAFTATERWTHHREKIWGLR